MCQLFLIVFCVSAVGTIYAQQSSQFMFRKDYEYDQLVDGWLKLHRSPATWFQARERCHNESSVLASPLYGSLQEAMEKLMKGKALSIFTGISSTIASAEFFPNKVMASSPVPNGDFFSVEGVPLDDIPTRWGSEEPGKHHCIAMSANGSLTDIDCSQSRPYICFKQSTSKMPKVNECGSVDKEYVYEEKAGSCYKFHKMGKTWIDAFRTCAVEGGYLAIINNADEAQVLSRILKNNSGSTRIARNTYIVGVGFHDWSGQGDWKTVHGETLKEAGYEQWRSGQPANDTFILALGEYCGGIDGDSKLHDVSCRYTITFICEMDPVDSQYIIDVRIPNVPEEQ